MNQTESKPKNQIVKLPAIFRVDLDGEDDAYSDGFIMFPTVPQDVGGRYVQCWQRVGQHSGADYVGCIQRSRPATLQEVGTLKALYEWTYNGIAGNDDVELVPYKRRTPQHRAEFEADIERTRKI